MTNKFHLSTACFGISPAKSEVLWTTCTEVQRDAITAAYDTDGVRLVVQGVLDAIKTEEIDAKATSEVTDVADSPDETDGDMDVTATI